MRKEYSKPIMLGEQFVADEYVSACWGVGCDVDDANRLERELNNYLLIGHRSNHCGDSSKQFIAEENGVAKYMVETGHDVFADMVCTLYSDSGYSTPIDVSAVQPGDKIYWVTKGTSLGVTYTYHHVGTVHLTDERYPNHS